MRSLTGTMHTAMPQCTLGRGPEWYFDGTHRLHCISCTCGALDRSGAAAQGASRVKYTDPAPGNIKGVVLVISANSGLSVTQPVVRSAFDCQKACALAYGCTAWVYCSRPEGCGAYCVDYHKKTGPRE